MIKNEEIVLQNKLIINPDVIEEGLKFVERETPIGTTKRRCDILFKDNNNKNLYVEVKEYVDNNAIKQITEYKNLVSNIEARFMLVANNKIIKSYEEQLTDLSIEYKSINKDSIFVRSDSIIEVRKGNSIYQTKENVLIKLKKQQQKATEIYDYVSSKLHSKNNPIFCNISDGIMFQHIERNEKFLSISTKGNRLLFHFPIAYRDEIYTKYKVLIPEIYRYKDKHPNDSDKEQNQIDIKLKDIKNFEDVKPLIVEAFNYSKLNR